MEPAPKHPIIFFDGVCGLCNRFVDRLLRRDSKKVFFFAPIQGETAKRFLQPLPKDASEWSIVYVDEEGTHTRSSAVLRIYLRLGGFWKIMNVFYILPRSWRDGVYQFIAARRYKWFGKKDACRVPSEEEKVRFLP